MEGLNLSIEGVEVLGPRGSLGGSLLVELFISLNFSLWEQGEVEGLTPLFGGWGKFR
jgi:hypothetical protein